MRNETQGIVGIAIYCSDPTPGVDLWRRMKKYLILPEKRFTAIGLLGAPICLAHPEYLPIEYALLMIQQIPFALRKFSGVEEIKLVGHNCGYYAQIPHLNSISIADQEEDIAKGAALLQKHFPRLNVTASFAEDENDGFRSILWQNSCAMAQT